MYADSRVPQETIRIDNDDRYKILEGFNFPPILVSRNFAKLRTPLFAKRRWSSLDLRLGRKPWRVGFSRRKRWKPNCVSKSHMAVYIHIVFSFIYVLIFHTHIPKLMVGSDHQLPSPSWGLESRPSSATVATDRRPASGPESFDGWWDGWIYRWVGQDYVYIYVCIHIC